MGCIPSKAEVQQNQQEQQNNQQVVQNNVTSLDQLKLKFKKQIQNFEKQANKFQLDMNKLQQKAKEAVVNKNTDQAQHFLLLKKKCQDKQKYVSDQVMLLSGKLDTLIKVEQTKEMTAALQKFTDYMKQPEIANLQNTLQDVLADTAQINMQCKQIDALLQQQGEAMQDGVEDDMKLLQDEINAEMTQTMGTLQKTNEVNQQVQKPVKAEVKQKQEVIM